jgi:hypothetical protein
MSLPINRQILIDELTSSRDILNKWIVDLGSNVPNEDFPANEKALFDFINNMCSEISLVSGKLDSIYSAISGR